MESLGNLPDGNGRGVVHKLIPQIRILDGVRLTNEGDIIRVETLDEAVGLIYQGASRARAAWAEEDATTEMAAATASSSRQDRRKDGRLAGRAGLGRRRSRTGVVGPGDGAVTSRVAAADHDIIVDWDSDLTQGGGQAFAGKPRSYGRCNNHSDISSGVKSRTVMDLGNPSAQAGKIRRAATDNTESESLGNPRSGQDDGFGLETKENQMSRGLSVPSLSPRVRPEKRNREAHSSDRVSEWRRETRSDSLSHEDLAALHVGSTSPAVSISPLVWTTYNRSVSSTQHHRLRMGEMHSDRANHAGKEGVDTDAGRGTTEEIYFPCATENAEEKLFRSGRGMSGRPWTTGQFGKLKRPGISDQNCASILGESNPLLQVLEQEVPKEGGDRRLRKRRPQTATFPARPCDDEELPQKVFSWQYVWQSLQSSQIVSGSNDLVEDVSPRQSGQSGPADRLRRVDFRKQRRARTARRRSARTGGISTGSAGRSIAREGDSASEGQANSSDCSAGTADRGKIKRRAADFSSSIVDPGVTTLNPSGPISTPRSPTMRKRNGERRREKSRRQQAFAGDTSGKARRKTSTSGASYQPFVVMDKSTTTTTTSDGSSSSSSSSSSEDGRSYLRAEGGRRRTQSSRNCSGGGDVKNRGEDCEGTPTAPGVSSLLASRKLGFDLRKSLAAIEEWTEQVTTARDGYGTPRQATTEGGQSILFFVQGECDAAASSCTQERLGDRQSGKVSRHGQRANACSSRTGSNPVKNSAAIAGRAKATAADAGRVDSEDNGSEDETVLSVEAARAALGISKMTPTAGTNGGSGVVWMPRVTATIVTSPTIKNRPHRPSPAEIDALTGGPVGKKDADDSTGRDAIRMSHQTEKTSSPTTSSGLAIGMSDEALEGMLRQHPRTVPELRTKESFRRFFQGMAEKRMSRLLRSAYEGTLPADEVDRKVKKRLRLVGDMLAWRRLEGFP